MGSVEYKTYRLVRNISNLYKISCFPINVLLFFGLGINHCYISIRVHVSKLFPLQI